MSDSHIIGLFFLSPIALLESVCSWSPKLVLCPFPSDLHKRTCANHGYQRLPIRPRVGPNSNLPAGVLVSRILGLPLVVIYRPRGTSDDRSLRKNTIRCEPSRCLRLPFSIFSRIKSSLFGLLPSTPPSSLSLSLSSFHHPRSRGRTSPRTAGHSLVNRVLYIYTLSYRLPQLTLLSDKTRNSLKIGTS